MSDEIASPFSKLNMLILERAILEPTEIELPLAEWASVYKAYSLSFVEANGVAPDLSSQDDPRPHFIYKGNTILIEDAK